MIRSGTLAKLLIIDDDPSILSQLQWGLSDAFEVSTAQTPHEAIRIASQLRPEVVALDLGLIGNDPDSGFLVLDNLLALDPALKVILVTGQEDRQLGVRALEQGAFDYFTKPVDIDELRVLLGRALAIRNLELENAELRDELGKPGSGDRLLGQSKAIQRIHQVVQKTASASVPVLITGEPGTGKEIAAREIHRLSGRSRQNFFSVSCRALCEKDLDTEIFGQDEGPEGRRQSAGCLERAQGGTVFLDDVGAMTPKLQVKLLRFLQERKIKKRSGEIISLDARILAATSVDLKIPVGDGLFREDLFYRLAVVTVNLPPLRERREDIVFAARHMLQRCGRDFHRGTLRFHRSALRAMQRYTWPGNLREMEHRIQRAVVLSSGRMIRAEDLQFKDETVPQKPLRAAREEAEREVISQSLRRNCGNIARASRELQISRPTLHDLLRKFSITAADFKNGIGPEAKEEGP